MNRRNAHLDENKRKAMVYSEKLSNYYDFIDEMIEKLESKRKNIDPRKGKLLLDKHQETVAEIQNNEKIYDDVRKEANKLNDSSKLPSGKMPDPYIRGDSMILTFHVSPLASGQGLYYIDRV